MQFFVVKVMGGRESYVAHTIRDTIKARNVDHLVEDILIPKAKVVKIMGGKEKVTEKNMLVGYLIIKMEMNREVYGFINTVDGVYGFLGSKNYPCPISEKEVESLLQKVDDMNDSAGIEEEDWSVGEKVKIHDGMFETFVGTISEVNEEKKRLKVSISIFSGSNTMTTVDLHYNQVSRDV